MTVTDSRATLTIRRPTAPRPEPVRAPTFKLDTPLAGRRIGLRTDGAWRSWVLIAGEWDKRLRDAGAETVLVETNAQIGDGGRTDRRNIDEWSDEIDGGNRRARDVRVVHLVQRAGRRRAGVALEAVGRRRHVGVRDARSQHGVVPRPR